MYVSDVKDSTKKHVQVRTSAEISEMVTFNKMGQAIQWVHAINYEKLEAKIEAFKQQQKDDYATYQQKVSELQTANDFLNQENQTLKELTAKFEAANKIIFEACKQCSEDNFGDCQNDCGINDLKSLLKIPRNNEQKLTCDKTREPPCHLGPSTELCGKCELNNCEKEPHK